MSFNLKHIAATIARRGPVVRVVIAETKGAAPRGAGTEMLVWHTGQAGTIGGGTLEFAASQRARAMLAPDSKSMQRTEPLGPALGQCCGGSVTLIYERFDEAALARIDPDQKTYIRRIDGDEACPPRLARLIKEQHENTPLPPTLINGWLAESLWQPQIPIWIFGAGHVGRATAIMLAALKSYDVTLIDMDMGCFPDDLPDNITPLTAANIADLVRHAPTNARHYIMTRNHGADFDICHALLNHEFAFAGLIGSKTKWARFKSRLVTLGHSPDHIGRITCPIGDLSLGKEPQAIAVGIVHDLLQKMNHTSDLSKRAKQEATL